MFGATRSSCAPLHHEHVVMPIRITCWTSGFSVRLTERWIAKSFVHACILLLICVVNLNAGIEDVRYFVLLLLGVLKRCL